MKKRNIVFGLILFFAMFSYLDVFALGICEYQWNEEWPDQKIIITKEDSVDEFDKITTPGYKFAKDNIFKLRSNGECPWVTFDQNKRLYISREKCLEANNGYINMCSWETSGKWTTMNDAFYDSLREGNGQAILIEKGANKCIYKSEIDGENYTLNIFSNNGSGYKPDLTCEHSESFRCEMRSDAAYFYGANSSTGSSFICPKYIYFEAKELANPSRMSIKIFGSGGDEDPNKSGVTSTIEGDVKGDSSGSTITTTDLDCDGIFTGRLGQFLMEAWKLIKFAVPILIIAFAIVDFIKAMSSHDEAEVKKAANKLVKRLVIGVLVFVLPTIIEYVLGLAGIEFGTCGIK